MDNMTTEQRQEMQKQKRLAGLRKHQAAKKAAKEEAKSALKAAVAAQKEEIPEKKVVSDDSEIVTLLDFTVDKLAVSPEFERDPNRTYGWVRKDESFAFKKQEGWTPVEGHPEYHDIKLMSRPKHLSEQQIAINEEKCRRLEGSVDQGMYRAAADAGRPVGVSPERVLNMIRSNTPSQRAGEQSDGGKRFYSVGIDLKK